MNYVIEMLIYDDVWIRVSSDLTKEAAEDVLKSAQSLEGFKKEDYRITQQ